MSHQTLYIITEADDAEEAVDKIDMLDSGITKDLDRSCADYWQTDELKAIKLSRRGLAKRLLEICDKYEAEMIVYFKELQSLIKDVPEDKALELLSHPKTICALQGVDVYNLQNVPFYWVEDTGSEAIGRCTLEECLKNPNGKYLIEVDVHY